MPDEKHHLGLCSKYRFPDLDPRDAASLLGSRVDSLEFFKMSVPTAPEQPADEVENQIKPPDPRPGTPPEYSSHFIPGPPGPALPPPVGYPGGLPVGYYGPQQPGTFPLYLPSSGTHPIQYQPGKYPVPQSSAPVAWMPVPTPMPNCPPGLEYLAQLDNIHVLQHFEPLEMITHFETNNRYDIKNNLGQMVYFVAEDTDDYTRNAYRTLRPFVLRVTDCLGQEIMTLQRPFRCTCCCFCCPSARQELEVQCPPGVTIGFVAEHWNLCRAVYSIQNEKKEDMMGVRGPCSTYGCGSDSVFEVKSLDGVSSIGSITRKWNGMLSTMSDADHFEIHFPLDLDVKMKAMIFGACFLIDFMYFESSPPQRSSPHHD
ncbi:Phospholipid scramblase 4 [Camelus dromedarius]|uniref:Phospholipid scramblase n=5 Tax=Camelus TaxID=9836 RepID=A0A5N4EJG0_CAMDR|nr:Phospholipid scramblase 4 [Camelus dromedarius]